MSELCQELSRCKEQLKRVESRKAQLATLNQKVERYNNDVLQPHLAELAEYDTAPQRKTFDDGQRQIEAAIALNESQTLHMHKQLEAAKETLRDTQVEKELLCLEPEVNSIDASGELDLSLIRVQVEELEIECQKIFSAYEAIKSENERLPSILKTLTTERDDHQSKCEDLRHSLEEAKQLKETIEGDLACLQMEYQAMNHGNYIKRENMPSDSLFSEVNQGRVVLQDDMQKLRVLVMAMKKKRSEMKGKLMCEKMKSLEMKHQWEDDMECKNIGVVLLKHAYQDAVTTLTAVNKEMEHLIAERNHLQEKVFTPAGITMLFFDLLDKQGAKIQKLEKDVANADYIRRDIEYQSKQCKNEQEEFNAEFVQMERKIEMVHKQIESAKQIEDGNGVVCICTL